MAKEFFYPDFSTLKQTKTCRTQLYHMSYTFYSSDDGVSDRGWGVRQQDSCFCYLSSFLFLVHLLLSAVCSAAVSALYPVIVSAVTALSHPVCPLCPPQTVEHGFPHQPSALSYSPSLQLLAIGTRSGAIKLYPSLYLRVNSCQGGI